MPSRLVALIPALWLTWAVMVQAAEVASVSRYIWAVDHPDHGGFSGFELDETGRSFVAVTDRGYILRGDLVRQDGVIVGIDAGPLQRLRDVEGRPLDPEPTLGDRSRQDAEGLAIAPDGTVFLSFEGVHRIRRYAGLGTVAQPVPPHPDFVGLWANAGLEALAIDGLGALYAVPERSGAMMRPFPVYRLAQGQWSIPYHLPRRGTYLPVGADFGPDGRLYLLERRFSGFFGFSTRLRRFALGPEGITGEETLLSSLNLRHGNLEGLSVWRDSDGALRLTMIADDNFSRFQRTEIVEYRLDDPLAPPERRR